MKIISGRIFILIGLFLAYLFYGTQAIRRLSPTYDEPFHLTAGYVMVKNRDYRYQAIWHPPLAEMVAALPLRVMSKTKRPLLEASHPAYLKGRNYEFSDFFFYQNKVPAQEMLHRARYVHWLVFLGILIAALAILAVQIGEGAVFWVLALLWIEPNLLAHGTLVTTDFSSAVLYVALWAGAYFFIIRPSNATAALLGMTLALSLTSKYTNALALGPLVFIFYWQRRRILPSLRFWRHSAIFAVVFVLVLVGIYQGSDPLVYWKGFWHTLTQVGQGRSSFFWGENATQGWRLYYLAAFFLKSNLAHLAAFVSAMILFGSKLRGSSSKLENKNFLLTKEGVILWGGLLLAGFHFLLASVSKVQIGLRYILPVYPFVILSGGWALAWLERQRHWVRVVPWAVVLAGALSTFGASPWLVSYFNELAGGVNGGYRFLTDSNNDWGQGLKELSRYLKQRGVGSVYLSYFGSGDPADYGIEYVPIGTISNVERLGPFGKSPTDEKALFLVISWTNYQATYYADKTVFDWLKKLTPSASLAGSMFVFDLTNKTEALENVIRLLKISGQEAQAQKLARFLAVQKVG